MTAARSTYFLLVFMMTTRGHRSCSDDEVLFFGKLNCSNTRRTSFFTPPVNTTFLDMGENCIQRLEEDFLNISQLLVLRLQNNQVNFIHRDAFRLLNHLRVLHLTNNRITNLDKHTFKLNTHLRWLDLSGNRIVLMKSFLISSSICRLDLSMNKLADIPEYTFNQLKQLTYLSLSSNNLKNINKRSFNDLKKVENLSLKGNSFICDCQLVELWKWGDAKVLKNEEVLCNSPSSKRGLTWTSVSDLECKNELGTYLLYGITSLLLIISLLLMLLVVRFLKRRRAKNRAPTALPRKPTPVPIGEYIEILPEKEPQQNLYETVNSFIEERNASEPHQNQYETVNSVPEERNTSDINRGSYLIPIQNDNEEPVYVNIRGPPLPQRSQEDKNKTLSQPKAPAPAAPLRRFSIPILDGCDFFEVVD